jgi:hypothetical protein
MPPDLEEPTKRKILDECEQGPPEIMKKIPAFYESDG